VPHDCEWPTPRALPKTIGSPLPTPPTVVASGHLPRGSSYLVLSAISRAPFLPVPAFPQGIGCPRHSHAHMPGGILVVLGKENSRGSGSWWGKCWGCGSHHLFDWSQWDWCLWLEPGKCERRLEPSDHGEGEGGGDWGQALFELEFGSAFVRGTYGSSGSRPSVSAVPARARSRRKTLLALHRSSALALQPADSPGSATPAS